MTTAEINAYLEWRAEREGKTVDVSPEAFHRDILVFEILDRIRNGPAEPEFNTEDGWFGLETLIDEIDALEKEN